ncbi:MAG: hypothetical protein R3F19_07550 [Verrucomicrobiales bacterium]
MPSDPADQRRTEARTNWALRHVMGRRRKWFILGLVGSSVLVFLWVAGVTYILPREYLGRAKILLPTPEGNAERIFATEMALIRSKNVLHKVIRRAELVRRWGFIMPSEVFDFMSRQLEIHREPGTSIVVIDFYFTDPDKAADTANLIAQSYLDYRIDVASLLMSPDLAVLEPDNAALPKNSAKVIEIAEANVVPVRPDVHGELQRGAALASITALPIGLSLAYLAHAVANCLCRTKRRSPLHDH